MPADAGVSDSRHASAVGAAGALTGALQGTYTAVAARPAVCQ